MRDAEETVKKLLQKAESAPFHEAALTRVRAQELIDKHKLDIKIGDIEYAREPAPPLYDSFWREVLLTQLARANGCNLLPERAGFTVAGGRASVRAVLSLYRRTLLDFALANRAAWVRFKIGYVFQLQFSSERDAREIFDDTFYNTAADIIVERMRPPQSLAQTAASQMAQAVGGGGVSHPAVDKLTKKIERHIIGADTFTVALKEGAAFGAKVPLKAIVEPKLLAATSTIPVAKAKRRRATTKAKARRKRA